MQLQNRNLQPNLRGDDVLLLQNELRQLGFTITDPDAFFGSSTFLAVIAFQQQHDLPQTGIVDAAVALALEAAVQARQTEGSTGYRIRGKVVHSDGNPADRTAIEVIEKGLRLEYPLASGTTDDTGAFDIVYPPPKTQPLSLIVRALDGQGGVLAESHRICDAGPLESVTIIVGGQTVRGPSEFAELDAVLQPLLQAEQLNAADLSEEEVEFLACRHDLNAAHVALYVLAAAHHRTTDIVAEAFYGLLRQNLPQDLKRLIAVGQTRQQRALEAAIAANIVGAALEAQLADILQALQHQVAALALQAGTPEAPTFATVFDIAGVGTNYRQQIMDDYVQRTGSVAEFWKELREDSDVPNAEIDALQDTLHLSAIALNHFDLVAHLTDLRAQGTIGAQVRDLATLDETDWLGILNTEVNGKKIGAPTFLSEDGDEAIALYATYLPRIVENLFPTPVLAQRLGAMTAPRYDFQPVLTFLGQNPEFEFKGTVISEYIEAHPDALSSQADPDKTVDELKAVQRLFEVAPSWRKADAISELMGDGLMSAIAIRRMGPTQFIRKYRNTLGFDDAQEMYAKAAHKADAVMMFISQSALFNPTNPAIIAPHLAGQGLPDLESLFGSMDSCACGHCNSVYSPAAYLTDMLHYLMNRPSTDGSRTALDVLFDRRPDLGEIELNCKNANTALPYLDLVLEILETAVLNGGTLPIGEETDTDELFPFQTHGETPALEAHPEHLNPAAYTVLRNAVYPWKLPFDLWLAEVRSYLGHGDLSYADLKAEYNFGDTQDAAAAVAAEKLGLSPSTHALITGAAATSLHSSWGFDAVADMNLFISNANAKEFLARTGLDYEAVMELFDVSYVNPTGSLSIEFESADCNLATATVTGLNEAALTRIHRFVRLAQQQDWSMATLGAILDRLDVVDLDDAALIALSRIADLEARLNVKLPVLLSWLGDLLPTGLTGAEAGKTSLYADVFLDVAVHNPALEMFNLNNAGTELAAAGGSLNDHLPVLYNVLGVSALDLQALIAQELPADTLNLAHLSRLYQAVTLSEALGLSIADYLSLRALSGIDPLGAGQLEDLRSFASLAERISASAWSVDDLNYLVREQQAEVYLSVEAQDAAMIALREALYAVHLEYQVPASEDALLQRLMVELSKVLPAVTVQQVMAMVHGQSELQVADQVALIEDELAPYAEPEKLIVGWEIEVPSPHEPTLAQKVEMLLEPMLSGLRRSAAEALVVTQIAGLLDADILSVDLLLRGLLRVPGTTVVGMTTFLVPAFDVAAEEDFSATTNPAAFPDQYATYRLLSKVIQLLEVLDIPAADLISFYKLGIAGGWPDFNELPVDPVVAAVPNPDAWLQVADILQAADEIFGSREPLYALLDLLADAGTDRTAWLQTLALQADWDAEDVEYLAGNATLDLNYPEGFRDGGFLPRLRSLIGLRMQVGVTSETLHGWAVQAPDVAMAAAVKQAARAQYASAPQWLSVAKPLRDALRQQQRDALVAHLLHTVRVQVPQFETPQPTLHIGANRLAVLELQLKLNMAGAQPPLKVDGKYGPLTRAALLEYKDAHGLGASSVVNAATWASLNTVDRRLEGPNELYAHFLIDVEMEPCMPSSRIVLAHSSVQLFVQRCRFNLEPEVLLSPEDAKEWEWMKRYRVWEANRKVFLYPENWVMPELRDDKTPLFRSLESGLRQGELNAETIEREFGNYLTGLNDIAQLEIIGIYRQWEQSRDILHVFGRTAGTPHHYYYRRWVDRKYWTPWEPVEIDIEGDHMFPMVWNQRLYLFWPIFIEKAEDVDSSGAGTPEEPGKLYEIRMAWTEYRSGKWMPKQVSNSHISTPPRQSLPPRSIFSFWPQLDDDNELYILYKANEGIWISIFGDEEDWTPQQFRFSSCNGTLEVTTMIGAVEINGSMVGRWVPFDPITHESRRLFPGTDHHYNNLIEGGSGSELIALTGGKTKTQYSTDHVDYKYLFKDVTDATVLQETPGQFKLVLPSDKRIFKSISPFFYLDEKRNFLVVPRGGYTGGPVADDFEFGTNNQQHGAPLELPDMVSGAIGQYFAEGAGNQASNSGGEPVSALSWKATDFRFENHYHPFVCLLIDELNRHGVDGVLKPDPEKEDNNKRRSLVKSLHRQQRKQVFFNATYWPKKNVVDDPRPVDKFDFSFAGAYSVYNWELFFHAPLLMAKRLSDHQQFREAMRWFHYIFDPTYRPEDPLEEAWPDRVWQIKPFFAEGVGESIQKTMLLLKSPGLTKAEKAERKEVRDQIDAWRKDPFNPHLIARMRPQAYMKATVMAYIDNLIACADQLFREDSQESIAEATQLYVLAAEILGERPVEIAAHTDAVPTIDGEEVRTFNDLRGRLDAFSNVLIELETMLEPDEAPDFKGGIGGLFGLKKITSKSIEGPDEIGHWPLMKKPARVPADNPPLKGTPLADPVPQILGPALFFCIPKNDKLLGYWDTVQDRLYKIRHCLNIDGQARQLALFQPAIDPGLLVKAKAAGLDIGSVGSGLDGAVPLYRFRTLAAKANESLADVKGLGAALLSAIEKRDAEGLTLLRSSHETQVLEGVREIRHRQIDEAKAQLEVLQKARDVVDRRRSFYANRANRIENEEEYVKQLGLARDSERDAQDMQLIAANLSRFLPDASVGWSGAGPHISATLGRGNITAFHQFNAQKSNNKSAQHAHNATLASMYGVWSRRAEDWNLQEALAEKELEQIDKQMVAAEIRIAIEEAELLNFETQVSNAKAVEEFLREKYSNEDLYAWLQGQISEVYFRSYQLAYDLASQAERAYRHELGLETSDFIGFGSWNQLRQGLLAGEQLQADLRKLEVAYLDAHQREFEMTRHVSLRQLDPVALLQLKATGTCNLTVPEWLYDLDCPGHYMRRIKGVSLSIPAVVGPYTSVNCTLSLQKSSVRTSSVLLGDAYGRDQLGDDPRFRDSFGNVQSIVTSSAQNDGGMFEFNLGDERFLPFEGAGAISTWKLELPGALRQFDYDKISDVVLHIRYTSRPGGGQLAQAATDEIRDDLLSDAAATPLVRLLSLKHDFPDAWYQYQQSEGQPFGATLSRDHLPYLTQAGDLSLADTPFELWRIDAATQSLVAVPFADGEVALDMAGLNGPDRMGDLQVDVSMDAEEEVFLLIKYRMDI